MSGGWKRAKHAGRRPLLWGLVCQARCVDEWYDYASGRPHCV